MGNIIVIGAGKKAEHLCDLFSLWDGLHQFYESPFSEDEIKRGISVNDYILGVTEQLYTVLSAIGDTRPKRTRVEQFTQEAEWLKVSYMWGRLIHQTSVVTNPKLIGLDFIMRELSSLGTQVEIGDHVSVGPLANVSHHSKIGDYSTICGQAAIGGSVTIGEGVFIGQGAVVKPGKTIGDGCVIGAGAVVVKDIPPNMVVAGNPAQTNEKFKGVEPW